MAITAPEREELRADVEALKPPPTREPESKPRPTNRPPSPEARAEWIVYERDGRNNLVRDAEGAPREASRWPIYNFMDLAMEDALGVLNLDGMTTRTAIEQLDSVRHQVMLLCPTMPEALVNRLSPNDMLAIARLSLGASEETNGANPPEPGARG